MTNFGKIILVRKKHCPVSFIIRWYLKSNYNHVGIFINENTILEVGACGHRTRDFKVYQNKLLYDIKILQLKGVSLRKLIDIVVCFCEHEKQKYNYFSFITRLLGFLTNTEPKRFTCSGFIAYVLEFYGIKIVDKHYQQVTPKDFETSQELISYD